MTVTFWTPDVLFKVNHIILIGWLALIFAPFNKLSKYIVLPSALFLSLLYTIILFQTLLLRNLKYPSLDFFHLPEWLTSLKDPFIIVSTTNHLYVLDLWLGQWMVNDFYSSYTFAYSITMDSNGTYQVKKSWTFGRIIFTMILLTSYMAAPFGLFVYYLNYQSFMTISNINQLQSEVLNRHPVRFEKNVRLFKKNPQNFIKESARLDKVVPMVNVLATAEIINEIEDNFPNIKIPVNTPIHCSLVNANRDKKIFQNPDEFLPERVDLNKLIVWNGVEEDILNKDKNKRPIRYCPGHDLSLDVIQYVAEQFLPIISDDNDEQERIINDLKISESIKENGNIKSSSSSINYSDDNENKLVLMNLNQPIGADQYCYNILDNYTKLVMKLMDAATKESNSFPSRASDILHPLNLPAKHLGIIRLSMAKFIPTWDEDEPNGSNLQRRIARWLVNQNIWDFDDCLIEFNTLEQAMKWRTERFSALPIPNVLYKDMLSDQAMTQLAFAGCACHYTHRIEKKWHPGYGIPDEKFLENVVYINDMTGLSTFRVRKSFERYGAAAYFDKDFQVIAIYWSHGSRLVKKGEQFWNHAKYVWRSSFFAYITISDHLIVTHMIETNAFVSASRKCLPSNHPLRIFIKPFTYHNISVNHQAATSLINERGLVHRIWAFDYDEFLKVCDYISMNYKFRILPNLISKTMHPDMNEKSEDEWDKIYPIYHDLNAFWKIIKKYVTTFFQINYNLIIENDDLPNDLYIKEFINEICEHLGIAGITSLGHFIDVLSQLIATNTGIHEHVGQISDYMIDPRFIGAKLQEGKEIQNIQTYSQILVLAVVTGLRMPGLLEDWSHLIEHNEYYQENLKNYRNFKRELKELSTKIDSLNKIRNYPFQSFNPKYMECSTSV